MKYRDTSPYRDNLKQYRIAYDYSISPMIIQYRPWLFNIAQL